MSKKLKCVNALITSMGRKKTGGWAKVKFQLTAAVTNSLDWPEMPEGTAEWVPDVDELQATVVEFTPNKEGLGAQAVCELEASSIGDFMVQRKKKKAGKNSIKADKTITEVICTIRFTDAIGCAKIEEYMQRAARSEMLVIYTPQPVQGELDGTRVDVVSGEVHATEEQRQAVLEMPLDEGAGQTHFDKVKQRIEEDKKKKKIREGK
jgi:hypothetical protein